MYKFATIVIAVKWCKISCCAAPSPLARCWASAGAVAEAGLGCSELPPEEACADGCGGAGVRGVRCGRARTSARKWGWWW